MSSNTTPSGRLSRIAERVEKLKQDPAFKELSEKVVTSLAVMDESDSEQKHYKGFVIDEADPSLFRSKQEVDDYLNYIENSAS